MCVTCGDENMGVIVINGSPRTAGTTAELLHGIETELKKQEIEVEYVDLSRIEMAHCKGCSTCYRTGHCPIRDDAEALAERSRKADGLVLGSPTYASNVSGLMKDLIDRGHFVIEQSLHGKPCITVATGENYGNKDARKVLDRLVLFSGGRVCAKMAVKTLFRDAENERKRVKKASDKMRKALLGKKKYPLQNMIHFVVFRFGIRPFVMKQGERYQGVRGVWKEMGIEVYR